MRLANERIAAPPAGPVMADRSRKQDFIDPQVLADVVKKIGELPLFPCRRWS
jgi:hypothetical protein